MKFFTVFVLVLGAALLVMSLAVGARAFRKGGADRAILLVVAVMALLASGFTGYIARVSWKFAFAEQPAPIDRGGIAPNH